jgi:hypothetical protein
MQTFPTVEQAFARVRREEMRQMVMMKGDEVGNISVALVSHRFRSTEVNLTQTKIGPQNQHKMHSLWGFRTYQRKLL